MVGFLTDLTIWFVGGLLCGTGLSCLVPTIGPMVPRSVGVRRRTDAGRSTGDTGSICIHTRVFGGMVTLLDQITILHDESANDKDGDDDDVREHLVFHRPPQHGPPASLYYRQQLVSYHCDRAAIGPIVVQ